MYTLNFKYTPNYRVKKDKVLYKLTEGRESPPYDKLGSVGLKLNKCTFIQKNIITKSLGLR